MAKHSDLLDCISPAIESIPVLSNETMKAYFERVMEFIKKKKIKFQ